jgi:hypothetical protein
LALFFLSKKTEIGVKNIFYKKNAYFVSFSAIWLL